MEKRLYRIEQGKVIAGVCTGLAEYFNIDVVLVRVIAIVALLSSGIGLLLYIAIWIAAPMKPVFVESTSSYEPSVEQNYTKYATPPIQYPKSNNSVRVTLGAILIVVGALSLIDELIPDWEWDFVFPAILLIAGGALLFTGRKERVAQI